MTNCKFKLIKNTLMSMQHDILCRTLVVKNMQRNRNVMCAVYDGSMNAAGWWIREFYWMIYRWLLYNNA
jgi:hypothetical protein